MLYMLMDTNYPTHICYTQGWADILTLRKRKPSVYWRTQAKRKKLTRTAAKREIPFIFF